MARHAIILDCDPGQDDAIAILLALAAPEEIELLAITAVAGNVPLGLTRVNARKVLELAGRTDVPVHAGCDRPLVRPLETAEHVHGETGLNGAVLPEPTIPLRDGHAVDAIIELVMSRPPRTVTIAAVGPLTNVALAIRKEPHMSQRLRQIVLMGGAIELGNITPAAEFNIYVDPHAADIVFRSGVPLVMFGLDVTHQVLVTAERLARLRANGGRVAEAVHGLLDFFNRFDMERYDAPGAPLHDPCVIAWLIDPTLFAGKDCPVEIELEGRSIGRTLVDWWNTDRRPANATVMRDVDADRFFTLLTDRLARL
ncbi:nucleoside hydrolase [Geminicoccus harenae]|uniref:nucleoside hydrolase n=3 Tax=Geminicoccus harenae TaxID=2498453 RepID=UPI001C98B2CC|nr:nucleoside hydrolase [Geminicoccus harenae]